MKRILFLTALLVTLMAKAQLPTDFRSEQIYLNPEKHSYMPGDSILVEGQVTCLAEGRFLPHSNYLYIECFNERDSVLVRQKVSCKEKGYFSTLLPTGYEWPAGVYYLRAYTRLMQNFSDESFAMQPILLAKEFPKRESYVYEARCTIVPSGGKLLAGHLQTATVLLTDDTAFPIRADLLLMNEAGDTIAPVRTSASGMATLRFLPKKNRKYYLTGSIDGTDYRFSLPETAKGIKIQGSLNGKRLNYQLLDADGKMDKYRLRTYDRLNGLTRLDEVKPRGIIVLDKVPEVLTLFLTDADNNILSECTMAGKQERKHALDAAPTIGLHQELRYTLPDLPEGARVQTRIVADNNLLATQAGAALNYRSDFDSPLPFPRHLYAAGEAEYNSDLHAWLSTARFKRFSLKEAVAKDTTIYTHLPEMALSFSGRIDKKNGRPMKDGSLVSYQTSNDYVYNAELTGDSARFLLSVDDFVDGEEFFLQAITAKGKPDFAEYLVDEENYPALRGHKRFRLPVSRYAASEVAIGNDFNLEYTTDKDNLRNYTLPNISVKARLRTEKPKETHEFYSTNFTDQEEIEERAFGTLYDILMTFPGITIYKHILTDEKTGGIVNGAIEQYEILSSRGGYSTLGGSSSLPILVDGVKFESDQFPFILNTPAFEIESVQLLRPWQALTYTFGAINGAILVKTRSYKDRPDLPSKGAMYRPTGLSPLSYPYKEQRPQPWTAYKPGRYRLLVDVFTETGVQSYEHPFEVVE